MGNLTLVEANNINVGERRVRGADLSMTYHLPKRPWGQLSLTGSAAYIDEYLAQPDPDAPELDLAGTFRDEASEGLGGIPEWKAQLGARWKHKRWRGSYDMHYVSSMEEIIPGTESFRDIDSWLVHDLQISYTFNVCRACALPLASTTSWMKRSPSPRQRSTTTSTAEPTNSRAVTGTPNSANSSKPAPAPPEAR